MTAAELAELIRSYRFRYWKEGVLQDGVEMILKMNAVDYSREYRLGERSRVDFLVESIGIEIKTAGATELVRRQLTRYAGFDEIEGLVLVTNKLRHRFPPDLGGKPLEVVHLTLHSL